MPGKAFFLMRLNDHVQYLKSVENALSGKIDFQGTSHQDCKLGKWLYGEGSNEVASLGNPQAQQAFEALFEPHEKFHKVSQLALQKKQAGDHAGSQAIITEMHILSHTIAQKLLDLDALS